MNEIDISTPLLAWYEQNARVLPWRGHPDPYAVWVSEIMLQQTRVETVIPYFERWMRRFPSLQDLALSSEQEVLQNWEGLGYYSRARNLHRAARQVVQEFGGVLPSDPAELGRLAGIGRYTAGAIASIAFGKDEAALDGNIRRVLARIFDVSVPARSKQGEEILWNLACAQIPVGRAGDFNQSLMDLGSSICTPRNPDCGHCPLNHLCAAFVRGVQDQRPVLQARGPVPHYTVTAAVISREQQVLIARRPADGLLGGMWEFPGGKVEHGETLEEGLKREIREELGVDVYVGEPLGVYQHAYTHFRVTLHAFYCQLQDEKTEPRPIVASEIRWLALYELEDFPMGKIDRQISQSLLEQNSAGFSK